MFLRKFSGTFLLTLSVIFRLISLIDCHPTYNKYLCLSPANERASNTYMSNLDSLLDSLSSKASANSFYNDSSNGIYSLFLCREDVTSTTCQTCVNNATQLIRQRCPSRKRGIVWYDECMLRYSNVSFFGRAETSTRIMMWNIQNTTSPDGQNYGALALIYSLIDEAPYTDMMFGTKEKVVANGNQHGYALVQCTRDINSSSCRACLGSLTEQIQNCCQNRRGWRILSFSCYLRYEENLFYQQSMAPVSPVPVMPQPMPNDGGKGGSNTTKIAIITVSSLAAVGGAILGFCQAINLPQPSTPPYSVGRFTALSDQSSTSGMGTGLFLCRGDVSTATCQICVKDASVIIRQRCPSNKTAIIWCDECMLRYCDTNFFGVAQTHPWLLMWNVGNTSTPDGKNYRALGLINSLIDSASNTDSMFGTKENDGSQPGFAMMHCTRDMNSSSCRSCLDTNRKH
ncbi:hypothetical protein QYF36_007511 [Acer negundo]|nr:hypothetical protein QYF36_007511 [Acer negundo]